MLIFYIWLGCKEVIENGVIKVKCVGGCIFRSLRERWWFIVISRCDIGIIVSICINIYVDLGNFDSIYEVEIYDVLVV